MSVHLHGTTLLLLDSFHEFWYSKIAWKPVKKIQISLKSEKNIGYLEAYAHWWYLSDIFE